MLRYPGGKTRAIDDLLSILNDEKVNVKDQIIYSPFYGGGSFEKYLHDKYNCTIIANDLFTPLYLFWKNLKEKKIELKTAVQNLHPINKQQFKDLQTNLQTNLQNNLQTDIQNNLQTDIQNNTSDADIKIAASYFALNRSSFSGTTMSGGFSKQAADKRFTQSSINRLLHYNMDRITISNQDFELFIQQKRKNNEGILFLDPPYHIKSKLYGNKGDLHENFDHERLANILRLQNNWILTYNHDNYIKKLYKKIKGVVFYDVYWSYGMNNSKKSNEIVILRFAKENP